MTVRLEVPATFCGECGFISCVCEVRKNHVPECKFRKAMETSVGIECDHGYDVCPTCDPCTCEAKTRGQD